MGRKRRTDNEIAGARETQALAATLGGEIRAMRRKRHLTQKALGKRVGLEQVRVGEIERGEGDSASLRTWVALGIALDRPFAAAFSRDIAPGRSPADAGHLGAQELLLRQARQHGRQATFELPTRPADPARSIDVGIRDDRRRILIVAEIWNRIDDLGAAGRAHSRKVAEAQALAAAYGGDDGAYRVAACWIIRATAANRALVAAYPDILRSRFPGSSSAWVRALQDGASAPTAPGLLWVDTAATRLFAVRWQSRANP